jgi:glycosyltransferase involved in cell wall biosynthesis
LADVYIAVINDLATDQRVHRVAKLLAERGMHVTCLGRRLRGGPRLETDIFKVRRFRMFFTRGPFFYASYNIRLFFTLLFAPAPRLFIANDLDTLPAMYLAGKIRRVKLIYDSHEFFTQVPELIGRKRVQSVWKWIEFRIVPRLDFAVTVSHPIAEIYRRLYGTRFRVVRNFPERRALPLQQKKPQWMAGKAVILYQGALNKGRGIELMIKAMEFLEDAVFVIVGTGDIEKDLRKMARDAGLSGRIRFMGRMLPGELLPITCSADLGISLEQDLGLNYRYAMPNKIFDYIQCRVPVLCSALPEMSRIVESYGVGVVLRNRDPGQVAKVVRYMISEKEAGTWMEALEKASYELCWENESKEYLALLKDCGILEIQDNDD